MATSTNYTYQMSTGFYIVNKANDSIKLRFNNSNYPLAYNTGTFNNGTITDIVGGTIFYIDPDIPNTCYKFYKSDMTEITSWATISDLSEAYYYSKAEVLSGNSDKFYVINKSNCITSSVMWINGQDDLNSYSNYIDILSDSDVKVKAKTGKRNTDFIFNTRNTRVYFPSHNSIENKKTIWDFCRDCNLEDLNNCNDWFIPSIWELSQLRNSGILGTSASDWCTNIDPSYTNYVGVWSSSAGSITTVSWCWLTAVAAGKDQTSLAYKMSATNNYGIVIRSF